MDKNRRDFLKILGIGSAAGMAGCSKSAPDALVPYVVPPEEMVRGNALWFRTTCRECPAGCGLEARVREGRVHKVEGNPEHPVNGGGVCARGQAAVQGLYNPDRLRTPLVRDKGGKLQPASWEEAEKAAQEGLARAGAVTVVSGAVRGALEDLIRTWVGPARHITYEPVAYEAIREANRRVFGIGSLPVLRFAEAKLIVLFGADVLETYISPVGYARGIAEARRKGARLVYAGPRLSLTAARADEWIPGDERQIARTYQPPAQEGFLAVAGNDPVTAQAVNLLNQRAGAINRTVRFDRESALDGATSRLEVSGAVVVVDTNPAYSAPHSLDKARFVVCLSPFQTETTEAAHVVFPIHTPLESWGDYEPWTGIHCLQQPAMTPVFDTREAGDVIIRLGNLKAPVFREYLKERWRKLHPQDFDAFWAESLMRGGWWREVPERKAAQVLRPPEPVAAPAEPGLRLITYPSLSHFDGRSANRAWLQELPDPVTQVVWDSWVEIHPEDAARHGIRTGNRVRVTTGSGSIETAAYVYRGIQPGNIAIPLGQGHTHYGRYASGVGANAFGLAQGPAAIQLLSRTRDLVAVGGSDLQHGREIARATTRPPSGGSPPPEKQEELSLYPPHSHDQYRWGMAIDLDACTACGACIVACYAENNIPVAGKERVAAGRIMSWIRLERFFGPGSRPAEPLQMDWTLMLCQQCDNAPCEAVCPVYAAYHNKEGLNGQIYNRCVGTRYCANNCPYRARRFNWFQYERPAPEDWQLNPDVTVRTKGVMEKCTFCIQRIVEAKDRARRENRRLADGDVTPACAQSCPAQAIVFGNLDDPASRVARAARQERAYRVFEELNTRPAVTYLERERRRV